MRIEILPKFDFGDWDICLNCIKGKQTKQISKNSATRSNELLGLIHTDIYRPFDFLSWENEKKVVLRLIKMVNFMKNLMRVDNVQVHLQSSLKVEAHMHICTIHYA
ncbi:hypothetical protein CR513_15332, partial [Mucuna pruriens]